jgi:hypothetical protein
VSRAFFFAMLLSWALLGLPAVASDDDLVPINFADNGLVYEFVGQVTNFPPSPSAPLGSSNQYGSANEMGHDSGSSREWCAEACGR